MLSRWRLYELTLLSSMPRNFYGRRPLLLLWAVSIGLLFRFQSPYRYHEVRIPYQWLSAVGVFALFSVEAAGLYYLLARKSSRSPARRTLTAAAICVPLYAVSTLGFVTDCSTCWGNVLFIFPLLGIPLFAGYALLLALYGWFGKSQDLPNEEL